jgi:glycogen(starch) synthase
MTDVLMTTDTVGGVWTYALDLARALASYDVTIHLATMGPPMSSAQRAAAVTSGVASVHESTWTLEWMPDPWPDVDRAGDWLLAVADDVRPDVVHFNGYVHAALPWSAPTVVVAHSDVLSWWQAVHGTPTPASWDTYRRRVAEGLHAADAVVAPTAAMLAELRRLYDLDRGEVIPNGRTVHPPAVAKQPLVVGAGRVWDEAKNLALLDRVAARLPWPAVIAGPTTMGTTGLLAPDEVVALFARAAVYVAPARYEPFGLGAVEAALAGCALVLGDIPSLREVWGDAAGYVHPDDEAALVEAVHRLTDDAVREQMAARARHRASGYTADRMARTYAGLYARLPARTGGRR